MPDHAADAELAAHIATEAGRILLQVRDSGLFRDKALGDAGDGVAQAFISRALKAARPDDAVLSEEEAANASRTGASRVWIVDPLDGTREYSEGRSDWAVHIALTIDGTPVAGAVALPGLDITFETAEPPAIPAAEEAPLRMLVSRTRASKEVLAVAEQLGATLVPMGSAGAKAMAVLRGEADVYLHSGGQYEWDSCAPVAVAIAAGLHASRADGSSCLYNRDDPYMPDLLICRREHADRVIAAMAAALPA
ncbi:MAG: 3'(2'),5'-bisphosphate nucleotidase CysQ [Alphaproteobacteria bacterium]|nr:3'(2'),5'-bisphosphate nucleotidase CysQ [Alphaproteobacteria bacterium]